jgi:hypothetical protein
MFADVTVKQLHVTILQPQNSEMLKVMSWLLSFIENMDVSETCGCLTNGVLVYHFASIRPEFS